MAITASILVDTLQGGNGLGCMLSQSLKGSMTRFVFWDIVIFSAVIGVLSFYLMGVIESTIGAIPRIGIIWIIIRYGNAIFSTMCDRCISKASR